MYSNVCQSSSKHSGKFAFRPGRKGQQYFSLLSSRRPRSMPVVWERRTGGKGRPKKPPISFLLRSFLPSTVSLPPPFPVAVQRTPFSDLFILQEAADRHNLRDFCSSSDVFPLTRLPSMVSSVSSVYASEPSHYSDSSQFF